MRADIAQLVEQWFCKPQVGGSNPSVGSDNCSMDGFPSGQRGQTVNLLADAFGGSNPPPSIRVLSNTLAGVV